MKIQKLVYFCHGWYLAITDQPLINEAVQAWQFGPVIPSLYHEFKRFGNGPITDRALTLEIVDRNVKFVRPSIPADPSAEKPREVIEQVWKVFSPYTPIALSNMTHAPGSPWSEVWKAGVINKEIPEEAIKRYFRNQAATHKA